MVLMTFEEMKKRYEAGEDSLELTLEKWQRILKYSESVFHLSQYQEILEAAVVPIFLCEEYGTRCRNCPIFEVCKQGRSEDWTRVMRIIQAFAIAGDMLSKEALVAQLEIFFQKLKVGKVEGYYTLN